MIVHHHLLRLHQIKRRKGSDALAVIEWKAVLVGYAAGFVIAAVIGHKIITLRPDWFSRVFEFVQ